ncbi:hypothetical protein [Methanosarcina sp.]|uniref:hypothetical protein n=1 Tax=Methanosarcina sp. TaxID=2213 RepID=UPI0029885D3A|nr:hypothetical protein [Methanosarcina sp.]MDW5549771.1 hypothetical protein [Methanosarcina sp.]MDW5555669.1 hypothetical protein [Methanosarcina sp.]MDW5561142.1 hypothetical protein [Methanosarcina sp.]
MQLNSDICLLFHGHWHTDGKYAVEFRTFDRLFQVETDTPHFRAMLSLKNNLGKCSFRWD